MHVKLSPNFRFASDVIAALLVEISEMAITSVLIESPGIGCEPSILFSAI